MSDIDFSSFTEAERKQILAAVKRTWEEVQDHDLPLFGVRRLTVSEALKLVWKSTRICDIGGLDKELYKRIINVPFETILVFMEQHQVNWY